MNEELAFLTLEEQAGMIARREVSAVAVCEATLERIERLDGTIGAYVTLTAESALESAREAEREIAAGGYRGPLHGIPISLKDIIYVAGVKLTAGSKALADFVPGYDSTITSRLREAGAVLIGKAQCYELAMGPATTYHFGPTRNPWDLERVTTGSSSGSAAAVSAFLCSGSIGSDTGGSIRGPASMCGVVGFKPTYGRVSRHGVVPLSWSLDHMGPITRSVADAALLMNAVAGYDPDDPTSLDVRGLDFTRRFNTGLRGLRIGVPSRFFYENVDPEYEAAVRAAIGLLEGEGAEIRDVALPSTEYAETAHSLILLSEAASYHEDLARKSADVLGINARTRLELGSMLLATDYLKAQRVRTHFQREFASVMKEVDVLVTPTSPGPPPRFDESTPQSDGHHAARTSMNRFRRPFNLVGAPAISVPCGFSSGGMPVGLQIVGRPMEDDVVLGVGHQYEQMTHWHRIRPPVG